MSQETMRIDLGDSLLIPQIAELHAQVTAACGGAGSIELDISRIERIDTAAMQLLCSLRKIDVADGGRIIWSQPSEAFMEAAGRFGMRRCFSFLERALLEETRLEAGSNQTTLCTPIDGSGG